MLDAEEIIQAALKLSPEEREQIVVELSASLNSNFASKEIGAAWLAEIDRRCNEVEEGKAVLHNWNDVRDEMLAELLPTAERPFHVLDGAKSDLRQAACRYNEQGERRRRRPGSRGPRCDREGLAHDEVFIVAIAHHSRAPGYGLAADGNS